MCSAEHPYWWRAKLAVFFVSVVFVCVCLLDKSIVISNVTIGYKPNQTYINYLHRFKIIFDTQTCSFLSNVSATVNNDVNHLMNEPTTVYSELVLFLFNQFWQMDLSVIPYYYYYCDYSNYSTMKQRDSIMIILMHFTETFLEEHF